MKIINVNTPLDVTGQNVIFVSKDSMMQQSLDLLNDDMENFHALTVLATPKESIVKEHISVDTSGYLHYDESTDLQGLILKAVRMAPNLIVLEDESKDLADPEVPIEEIVFDSKANNNAFVFPDDSMMVLLTGHSLGAIVDGEYIRETLLKFRRIIKKIGYEKFDGAQVFLYAEGKKCLVDLELS